MMASQGTTGARVLIVDDEAIIARHVHNYLIQLGYEVIGIVSSAEEAVETAVRLQPDLLLMDIELPGPVDGIEAVRRIRSQIDVPVVYLTAYSDDVTIQRAESTGPFGYIIKPFQARELRITIEMALRIHSLTRALERSEARYRAIVEDQSELICRFLPDGTLTFVNEAFCRYFGHSRAELLGSSYWARFQDYDQGRLVTAYAALTSAQPVLRCEQSSTGANGDVKWQSWTVRGIFDEQGQLREIQAVGRDITEQKLAEQALNRIGEEMARRLEECTADLDRVSQALQQEISRRERAEQALRDLERRLQHTEAGQIQ